MEKVVILLVKSVYPLSLIISTLNVNRFTENFNGF